MTDHDHAHVTLTLQIRDGVSYGDAVQDLVDALASSENWKLTDPGVRIDPYQVESLGDRFEGPSGPFTIPQHAEIVRSSDGRGLLELFVDGVPFPYAIARDSITATPTAGRGPDTLALELIVDRITITDAPKETTP